MAQHSLYSLAKENSASCHVITASVVYKRSDKVGSAWTSKKQMNNMQQVSWLERKIALKTNYLTG